MFSLLIDFNLKQQIKVNLDSECHFLIVGNTGVGKTTFCKTLLAKIGKYYPDAELYLLDFKSDKSFTPFKDFKRYYKYVECEEGLNEVYERFSKRLSGEDIQNHHIILFFDELNSFINFIEKKIEREQYQKKIAEMLHMGRTKNLNVIVAMHRPDAELLKYGSRNQFVFKLAIANTTSETRKMIFTNTESEFSPCKKGFGYVALHDNPPKLIAIPNVTNHQLVEKEIMKLLSNNCL